MQGKTHYDTHPKRKNNVRGEDDHERLDYCYSTRSFTNATFTINGIDYIYIEDLAR